jgi:hypothetical protein
VAVTSIRSGQTGTQMLPTRMEHSENTALAGTETEISWAAKDGVLEVHSRFPVSIFHINSEDSCKP